MKRSTKIYYSTAFLLATIIYLILQLTIFKKNLWNPDEGYLLVEAKLLEHGGRFYDMVIDRKTPLLPSIYFIFLKIFKENAIVALHILFCTFKAINAFLIFKISKFFTQNKIKRFFTIPVYLLITLTLPVSASMASNFESLTVFFLILSYFSLIYKRDFLLGISAALALLSEQRALIFLVHIIIYLIFYFKKPVKNLIKTGGVFLLTICAFAPIIFNKDAFFWIFKASDSYLNPFSIIKLSFYNIITYFGIFVVILLVPLCNKLIFNRKNPMGEHLNFLYTYIYCGLIAVTTTFHFFDHYFIFLIPQISILIVLLLSNRVIPIELLVLAILSTYMINLNIRSLNPLHKRLLLTGYIVNQITKPNDRVIFWTMYPETYLYANRLPGTRFLTPGFVFNYSAIANYRYVGIKYGIKNSDKLLLKDAEKNKVQVIVDDCNNVKICSIKLVPGFADFLSKYYRIVAIIESAIIYQRI